MIESMFRVYTNDDGDVYDVRDPFGHSLPFSVRHVRELDQDDADDEADDAPRGEGEQR